MKRIFLLMAVIAAVAVTRASAGEESGAGWDGKRRMAVTTSPSPLVLGAVFGGFGINAGFEFAPIRHASAKLNVHYVGFDPLRFAGVTGSDGETGSRVSLFRLNLEGRWYPQGRYLHGWFLNGGLQFHRLSASAWVVSDDEEYRAGIGFNTWSVFAGVGYKAIFGMGRTALVLEPGMDLAWRLASDLPATGFDNIVGWLLGTNGVRFSLLFGAAF